MTPEQFKEVEEAIVARLRASVVRLEISTKNNQWKAKGLCMQMICWALTDLDKLLDGKEHDQLWKQYGNLKPQNN